MKLFFSLLLLFPVCLTVSAQQWEVKVKGGTNISLLNDATISFEQEVMAPTTHGTFEPFLLKGIAHTKFKSSFGGYLQGQLFYRLNDHWRLAYGAGAALSRFRKITWFREEDTEAPVLEYGGENPGWSSGPGTILDFYKSYPKLGNTRLWHFRQSLGVAYQVVPKISVHMEVWTSQLLSASEFQLYFPPINNPENKEFKAEYSQSNGFKKIVGDLETGISYSIFPALELNAHFAVALSPLNERDETTTHHEEVYLMQVGAGAAYSVFRF